MSYVSTSPTAQYSDSIHIYQIRETTPSNSDASHIAKSKASLFQNLYASQIMSHETFCCTLMFAVIMSLSHKDDY